MDLRSHYPFWLLRNGILNNHNSLSQDVKTPVVIIGAGITGALIGYHLAKAGMEVCFLDRRHAGMGSTCASTALLQYEIDTPLHELTDLVGKAHASRSYQLCAEAVLKLEEVCQELNADVGFERKKSLFFASSRKDVKILEKELPLRQQLGLDIEYLEKADIDRLYQFEAPAALLSSLAAQVDAYRLTHALLQKTIALGGRVFTNTTVTAIRHEKEGVVLKTDRGHEIAARHLVLAAGYESQQYLPDKGIIRLNSTFALVSEPMTLPENNQFWHENSLIWETAHPYLYLRTTPDNRILVGGKDEPFYNPEKRDALLKRKKDKLSQAFHEKMPHLNLVPDFYWAGTFAETKDGLPYIGQIRQHPDTFFALGFGGNGITFSLISAEIIRDRLTGRQNEDEKIFSFSR